MGTDHSKLELETKCRGKRVKHRQQVQSTRRAPFYRYYTSITAVYAYLLLHEFSTP